MVLLFLEDHGVDRQRMLIVMHFHGLSIAHPMAVGVQVTPIAAIATAELRLTQGLQGILIP